MVSTLCLLMIKWWVCHGTAWQGFCHQRITDGFFVVLIQCFYDKLKTNIINILYVLVSDVFVQIVLKDVDLLSFPIEIWQWQQ